MLIDIFYSLAITNSGALWAERFFLTLKQCKMKQTLLLAAALLSIAACGFFAGILHTRITSAQKKLTHQCIDSTHATCDGRCECDGMGCPNNALESIRRLRDYQISLHMDTVWLYDGDRLVGSYISNWNNQMDSFIVEDNQ